MNESRYMRPLPAESLGQAQGRGRLKGRRALIVGGGQSACVSADPMMGNGRAMSLLFAREGADVAVADASMASAEETVSMIAAEGHRACAVQVDVRHEREVVRMIEAALSVLGGIDALVVNVGVAIGARGLKGLRAEDWNTTVEVNLRGAMFSCREALQVLDPGSSIVLISSTAALKAGSELVAYDASKAALGALMRHVALEGARSGVRVNTICPGFIDTPFGRQACSGLTPRSPATLPFGRMGTPWEVAYAALFLISNESVYVNAQTLAVDGGLSSA